MKVMHLYPQNQTASDRVHQKNRLAENRQAESETGRCQAATGACDTVQFSHAARSVQRAGGPSDGSPEVRAEKVAELQKQIADGTYKIDTEAIAAKMLEDAFAFRS